MARRPRKATHKKPKDARYRYPQLTKIALYLPSVVVAEIRMVAQCQHTTISDFVAGMLETYGFSWASTPPEFRTPKGYKTRLVPYLPKLLLARIRAKYGQRSVCRIVFNAYTLYKQDHYDEVQSAVSLYDMQSRADANTVLSFHIVGKDGERKKE